MDEYIPLKEAYDIAVAERDQYYQDAVNAKADTVSFMLGARGLFFSDDGKFGVAVDAGVGWGDITFTAGAEYKLLLPFDFSKIIYTAGVQYRF